MSKSSLMDRMKAAGSIKETSVLSESKFFGKKDLIATHVPALNVAFSGEITGGMIPGLTIIAGPSKHYKSNIGLIGVRAYLDKYDDAICLFYDSEFGITPEYLNAQGVDPTRVLHIPIEHIEQLKFDIVKRLDEIKRGDHIVIFVDSLGNLASKKETEDALEGKAVADMSRAKAIKSLFRIITPSLTAKDLPCLVVNHTYMEQGMFPKAVVSGGTGVMYSANTVFIVGRSQEKEGTDVVGYNFTLNIEKSRFVKEKSKIALEVRWNGGVSSYSGILDLALESGHVVKPSNGWYQLADPTTGEILEGKVRAKDTNTKEFLGKVLLNKDFQEFVKNKYKIVGGAQQDDIEDEVDLEDLDVSDED